MPRKIELLAGYWTIAGDCYAMGPSEVSPFPLRERVEAASAAGYTGLGLFIRISFSTPKRWATRR